MYLLRSDTTIFETSYNPLNIGSIPRGVEEVWRQPNFRRMGIASVPSQQSSYKPISTTGLRTA